MIIAKEREKKTIHRFIFANMIQNSPTEPAEIQLGNPMKSNETKRNPMKSNVTQWNPDPKAFNIKFQWNPDPKSNIIIQWNTVKAIETLWNLLKSNEIQWNPTKSN